jgi:hypothetical protein
MNVSPGTFWLCALLPIAVSAGGIAAEPTPLETVEKSAGDWLKVRAETSRLETEWNAQHPLLESMAHALTERAQTLELKLNYLRAKTAKDREELANLEAANRTGAERLQSIEGQLKETGTQLIRLRPSLPPRLSSALELPYKSLAQPGIALGDRLQFTMTVLNRSLQFNRTIVCENEALDFGDSEGARQLEVIYWGLGHGYALDHARGKAWFGTPGAKGEWQWEEVTNASPRLAKLIGIYYGKEEPEFVEMPGRLKNQAIATPNE